MLVGIGVVLVVAAVVLARRTSALQLRGAILAGASGVLFGLVAGLVKLAYARLGEGFGTLLTTWPLWALVVTGISAVLLNQWPTRRPGSR